MAKSLWRNVVGFLAGLLVFMGASCSMVGLSPGLSQNYTNHRQYVSSLTNSTVKVHTACTYVFNKVVIVNGKRFVFPKVGIKRSHGSGVIIKRYQGKSFLLTAQHVVDSFDAKTCRLYLTEASDINEIRPKPAVVVSQDKKRDLALLSSDFSFKASVNVAREIQVGDRVAAVGFPMIDFYCRPPRKCPTDSVSFTEGNVATKTQRIVKISGKRAVVKVLRVTSPIFYGSSGGGVFNSAGELVGIVSYFKGLPVNLFAPPMPYAGMFFAISAEEVRDFLVVSGNGALLK